MSKFHLISFNAAMREALAAGRKTQTRRLEKRWPEGLKSRPAILTDGAYSIGGVRLVPKYGPVGSVLVVRESWAVWSCWDDKRPAGIPPVQGWDKHEGRVFYQGGFEPGAGKLRHERFMPYWAGRTLLRVEKIRFQPVGEISDRESLGGNDCAAEGIYAAGLKVPTYEEWHGRGFRSADKCIFACLWDSIHGAGSFASSPMVWAYTFRVIDPASEEYKELRAEIMAEAVRKFEARPGGSGK